MFIVMLRFADNKARAAELMAAHNTWIKQGFDDGVFLLVGSIEPGQGGSVMAHGCTLAELERRVQADPFVSEGVVSAEIIEIAAKKADPRLQFLLEV